MPEYRGWKRELMVILIKLLPSQHICKVFETRPNYKEYTAYCISVVLD